MENYEQPHVDKIIDTNATGAGGVVTDNNSLLCLACKKPARWCGEGKEGCGTDQCPAIHCDSCGMHYSLESEEACDAETFEQARSLMLGAYKA